MSRLLIHPSPADADGRIHAVTPDSAGWRYVGFEVYRLSPGQRLSRTIPEGREACLVLVSGRAEIAANGAKLGKLGSRRSPFDGSPWSVYLPPGTAVEIEAEYEVELALGSAPATGTLPLRVIPPVCVGQETRGHGTNTRYVRNILPEGEAAESLLVVEVITPGGHWSSYPSHKHDTDDFPERNLSRGDLLPPPCAPRLRAAARLHGRPQPRRNDGCRRPRRRAGAARLPPGGGTARV